MPTFVENETELRTATGTAVTTTSGGGQLVGVELTRTAGETQQGQDYLREQLALLLILLSFYCLPIFLVTILSLIDIFHQESHRIEGRFVEAVRTVATDPAAYTNIINQMIMPTAAAITAVNYRSIRIGKGASLLFVLPLFGIFACILNALLFNVYVATGSLTQVQKGVVSQLFINSAGNLAVYVMMLVGLKLGQHRGNPEGAER